MAGFSYSDLVHELLDCVRDHLISIRKQVRFSQASVYKNEIIDQIHARFGQMSVVAKFIGDHNILDLVQQFEKSESIVNGNSSGHADFAYRIFSCVDLIEQYLDEQNQSAITERLQLSNREIRRKIRRNKRRLLSVCTPGSRSWAMIQSFR